MIIKILGTGCSNCKTLENTTKYAVNDLKLDADVIKEEDMMKIMKYSVISLPALVIDDKVVSAGKRLKVDDIKKLINNEITKKA
jgi:small redox-active disulfide protein 2